MDTVTTEELVRTRGAKVYSSEGEHIGSVEEIFVDEQRGRPEWIGLGTGFLGTKRVLVPVEGATMTQHGVEVPYSKERVQAAPDIDADELGPETERALYAHYGLGYAGENRVGTADEAEIVRSEEELRVGKRETEAGRVRVRKWVEAEPVAVDVALDREVAVVTREPVNQPVTGAAIGQDEVEIPLHAEEAVVQKQTVAKERIGLEKRVEAERQTVSDEVRKERVEIEGDTIPR